MTRRPQLRNGTQSAQPRETCCTSDDPLWQLLLALCRLRRQNGTLPSNQAWRWHAETGLEALAAEHPSAELIRDAAGLVTPGPALMQNERDFLALYLPLLTASPVRPVVIGHLGQSLDAYIACRSGDAEQVTDSANIVHLHRLRALCDAIVVGAGTIAADDPRLTTRRVPGENPCRLVIDPQARLSGNQRLFHDNAAPTLRVCAVGIDTGRLDEDALIQVPSSATGISLPALLEELKRRNLHAIFVEGGGVTVSDWYRQHMLDRLHLAVAPVLIGVGIPALKLPAIDCMTAARRHPGRLYRMGTNILWDLDLRNADADDALQASERMDLERLI